MGYFTKLGSAPRSNNSSTISFQPNEQAPAKGVCRCYNNKSELTEEKPEIKHSTRL